MSESNPVVPKRGEAAWKAVKDDVAARNDATKRAAKKEREAHNKNADTLRRAATAKRQERLEER
jgi:hypothetical protein